MVRTFILLSILIPLLFFIPCLYAAEEQETANPAPTPAPAQEQVSEKENLSISGYLKLSYLLRYTTEYTLSNEEDQDIRGLLTLDIKDREKNPKNLFHMLGNINIDIDGKPEINTGPYASVYDTYDNRVHAQLYSAYLVSKCETLHTKFTLGRQSIYKGEALDFDGLRTETTFTNVNFSLYGGIPSNFWESSHEGDSFGGGGIEAGIPKKFSVRCDYIHIRDKKTAEPLQPVSNDDLAVLSAKYLALKPLSLYGLYSHLEGEERRTVLRAKWADKYRGLIVSASYLRQNIALTNYSTELSPYYVVLMEYAPYYRYNAMALKELSKHFSIEAGTDVRKLEDEADEGVLNHSYERYYGSAHVTGLLDKKLDITMSWEKWHSSGRRDRSGLEGFVKLKATPKLKLQVGTDFSKYKYDYNLLEEKEDVTSYFVRADYELSKFASARFKYSFERTEREDYNLFEFSMILSW